MATTLLEAARRLGIDTNTDNGKAQGETSAPEALTPEQIAQGLESYNKFMQAEADRKAEADKKKEAEKKPLWQEILTAFGNANGGAQGAVQTAMKESHEYSLEQAAKREAYKPREDWSEEERARFGLEYANSVEAAEKYAYQLNLSKDKAEKDKTLQSVKDWSGQNFVTGALATAGGILASPLGIVDYMANMHDMGYSGIDTGANAQASVFEMSQAGMEGVAEQLNTYGTLPENWWIIGGKGFGDLYGLGTSVVQSSLTAKAFGPGGTLLSYFGQSAARGVDTAKAKGASDGQAMLYGALMGAAEAIPEMISADALLGIGKEATKSLFKQVLKQAGEEAGEEATTSILELVIDKIVFGESNIGVLARQYEASGMSHDEAVKKAWIDSVGEVLYSAVSGFVSGGVSGSGAAAISTTNLTAENRAAKKQLTPRQSKMFEQYKTVQDSTDRAMVDKLAAKVEKGEELSGYELRRLQAAVADGKTADIEANVKLAIAERLKSKGVKTEDISALTNIIMNKALGQNLTKAQQIRLKNSEVATAVANELDINNMLSGNFDSQWAIDAGINQIRDTSEAIKRYTEQAETETADMAETPTSTVNLSAEAKGALRQAFTGQSGVYTPQSENTRIHTDEVKSTLNAKQTAQIRAIEKVANALGVETYIYESELKNGVRSYTTKDGAVITDNGYYDPKDKSVHIDLHAGETGKGTMLFTASHELVHWVKDSALNQYESLQKFVIGVLHKEGVQIDTLIKKQIDTAKASGREMSRDEALEEIVADACMSVLSTDAGIKAVTNLKTENRGLWNTLKRFFTNFFNRIDKMYKGVKVDSEEGQYLADMHEEAKRLRDLFAEAVSAASEANKTAAKQTNSTDLAQIDTASESVSPIMHSYRTWTESEYVKQRAATIERVAAALGIPKTKVAKYIDDVNSIAKMIADDRARLDYEASSFGSAFVSNVEYGGSFDYTTLCKKRRIYTGTFSEIQKRLGDVALTPDDILEIRNLMIAEGIEATCGLCYVEGSRANMGKFAKEFIRLYKRDNPNAWTPTMVDVNTPDGVEQMRINHPDAYEQYEYVWNHYGKLKDSDPALFASQQKPKLYEARKEYKGEILKHFKGDMTVAKKNLNGGIRMQSFSDFEIVHLIDTMQVIMDMSTVGLAGQAYTKVPEFAQAFGGTGLKINLSLIAKGVDADGNLIFDDREGMPSKTAFELRDKYSENVGTIIVAFTDEQIFAAMADDRIDFIIPFHRSQWKKGPYGAMGLPQGTKDYTNVQNEKLIKPTYHEYRGRMVKDKATNYMPNEYWDFTKSGKENAEAYLEMCAKNNKRPKFYKFLDYDGNGKYSLKADGSTDGYWKLLIDFKMYDNNGVGSPQRPVMPDFNMDESIKMLNEYRGGHSSYPVANSVVDKFVEGYNGKKEIKHSGRKHRISDTQAKITARYKRTVDKIIAGTYNSKDSVLMGYTPEIFRTLGMPSLPFVFGAGHIYSTAVTEAEAKSDSLGRYNRRTNYHGLGVDTVKKLYSAIQDPIMIIAAKDEQNKNTAPRSLHSVVAIIDVGDSSKHLLMPVEITAERVVNGNRINVNTLSSSYMKDVNGLVEEAIAQTNTGDVGVYYMKKEATNLLSGRVQFPKQLTGLAASANGIIHQFSEKINMQIDDVTKSSQFTNWFGDWQNNPSKASKVVNDDGTPMIVYHGSKSGNIKTFRTTNENGTGGLYLTTNRSVAESYAGDSGEVYENYVNIRRPLIVDADGAYYDNISTPSEMIGNKYALGGKTVDTNAIAAFARDAGYDGVIVRNVRESGGIGDDIIAFSSNQIKSIDNVGTFDKRKDNTMYSPRKKRTVTLSVGEEAKFRANYTRAKVFSKSNMHRIIEKFIGKGELTAKTTEELADDMWISFNTATSVEERREFAHSAAEFVVAKLLQERKVESAESKAAAEQLLYLKSGIRRIEFTEQEIEEIRHKKDESGLKSIRARWGYQKSRTNDRVLPYPMDVFVTDVAREIPGMEYLADMNHIDAFFEIIEHYDSLKKTAADKWVSAYLETSDSDLESLQMEIEQTIFEAYETEGEESKFSKFVSAKIGAFQERALFWKAEHDRLKGRSRFENLIVDKARKFEELKKGTFLNATQYKADAFKDSIEKLSTLKFRGNIRKPNAVRDIFKPILEWYSKENPMLVDPNAEDGTPHKYSYEVAAMLEVIANGKDGLSNDELAAIYEVMNYFTKFIETYNKIWRNGKWIDAADVAQTDIEILNFVATSRSAKGIRRSLDKYLESFAEPMAYARMVDGYQNGFYTQTMTELREASIKAALEEMNIRAEYDQFLADHKDYVKTASTELVDFKGIKIPKMELIGLYMTYKRKHAQAGLIFNGFQFERRISKYSNDTETISVPGAASPDAKLSQAEFDNLVNMEMKLISTKLSATDKAYIEMLERLYNGKLRNLKIKRDMDRLGFTNATLDYYYPIRRATIAKSIDAAVFDDVNRATNSTFNKNTVKGARQKLRIDSADALINRHIHEICNYAYMSGAIENYNTVYNIDISGNPNSPVSVRTTVEATSIWKKSQEYFRKLVKDMQGISGDRAPLMDAIGKLRSGYVRFALGLNLKTIFTQASSVFAATDVLDYSSIVKGMHLDSTGVDDYCPYAKLRNYDQSAIKALSVSDKVDKSLDWVTKGISFTDRVIICRLFGACQVQAEKNGAGAVGTEANKIAAGKLLEKVIIDTQANSLATERSAAMRSDNEILKSIVMFTADSMKVASRVLDAAGELKMLSENGASEAEIKQAKVKLVKSVITVVNIAVYMTCIAQLFRWIYNRDEDEEEVPLTMAVDFIGNLFAGVPILSEIADFFLQGYEVENSVLDSANTILSGIRDLSTDCWNVMFNRDEAPSYQKWHRDTRTFIYAIAQMVGVPVRNVYNLISGIIGNFSEKAEYRIDDFFYENNYYSDLEEALQEENSGKVDLLLSLSYGKPFGEGVTDATVTELNRLARVDKKYLALPKTVPDKITRDGIEYTLTDNQKQQILTEYSKVNAAIDKLVNSASYQKLSDDKKAERLKYYYSEYFNAAVTKVLKLVKSNTEVLQGAIGFDTYAKFHFATKGIKSDTDKNGNTISGSKRKKVIAAIDKLNLTAEKRLLLIASKGYSLSESERTKLIRYINSLKLTESSKKALAEMCGFEVKNGKIVYK